MPSSRFNTRRPAQSTTSRPGPQLFALRSRFQNTEAQQKQLDRWCGLVVQAIDRSVTRVVVGNWESFGLCCLNKQDRLLDEAMYEELEEECARMDEAQKTINRKSSSGSPKDSGKDANRDCMSYMSHPLNAKSLEIMRDQILQTIPSLHSESSFYHAATSCAEGLQSIVGRAGASSRPSSHSIAGWTARTTPISDKPQFSAPQGRFKNPEAKQELLDRWYRLAAQSIDQDVTRIIVGNWDLVGSWCLRMQGSLHDKAMYTNLEQECVRMEAEAQDTKSIQWSFIISEEAGMNAIRYCLSCMSPPSNVKSLEVMRDQILQTIPNICSHSTFYQAATQYADGLQSIISMLTGDQTITEAEKKTRALRVLQTKVSQFGKKRGNMSQELAYGSSEGSEEPYE
ncbi:MAG: hypothetical protein TREMPRED_001158 [Tremellales sp. Tagirdzhanova-0007]|nr:MAG: hypothetical protein TREMPRED_001158 [Tremellales sp. Tagirdzhanova-0007]